MLANRNRLPPSSDILCVPVCLLGINKTRGGLGIALVEHIVETRAWLRKEKKAFLVIVAMADDVGSISPKERYPASFVLHDDGGVLPNHLAHIIEQKKAGGSLEPEPQFGKEGLGGVLKQSIQPGMVIVDQMPKAEEDRTLKALETISSLGCSLIMPLPRPEAYKKRCRELFGDRLIEFAKPPSVKKLLYTILESYDKNPRKHEEIDPELVRLATPVTSGPTLEAADGAHNHSHEHDEHCDHDHDHGHAHGHAHSHEHDENCDHDHGHGHHSHDHTHKHEHVHGEHCNHSHDDEHDEEEQARLRDRFHATMKLVASDPEKCLLGLQKGNSLFVNAVTELCSFGPDVPQEFRAPSLPENIGYGPFFAERDGLKMLLSHAQQEAALYFKRHSETSQPPGVQMVEDHRLYLMLNAIRSMVTYPGDEGAKMLESFVEGGGLELLRGTPLKTSQDLEESTTVDENDDDESDAKANARSNSGSSIGDSSNRSVGLLRTGDPVLIRIGDEIIKQLTAAHKLLRVCDYCGRRESKIEEWKKCSRCRFSVYCARDCQVTDWKDGGHKRSCARLRPGAGLEVL